MKTKPGVNLLRICLYGQPIGTLTRLPSNQYHFTFDEEYIHNPSRPTLSLSFKDPMGNLITQTKMTHLRLPPFFSNLLPEGPLRELLARRAHLDPDHEFSLLWALGQDLPGAITVQPVNQELLPPLIEREKVTSETKKKPLLRFSLAGIQLKFSAVEKVGKGLTIPANGIGGKWIVKLPHAAYPGVPENEYTMMELARRMGIEVPKTALVPIEEIEGLPSELKFYGQQAFAIQRFDRSANSEEKIHIEDLAQVFSVYPEQKYTTVNYRTIAAFLWKETKEAGIVEFLKRFVFNVLIGNGDMHLKNWSLIYRQKNRARALSCFRFPLNTLLYPRGEAGFKLH